MNILDTGVHPDILQRAKDSKRNYRLQRKHRIDIEQELENRILPSSFSSSHSTHDINTDTDMLQHWLNEIDQFEQKMKLLQDSILSSEGTASLLKEDLIHNDTKTYHKDDPSFATTSKSFPQVLQLFVNSSWDDDANTNHNIPSSPTEHSHCYYYSNLLDLKNAIQILDSQLVNAQASCDLLSSLSSNESVVTALEKSRNLLFQICSDEGAYGDKINKTTEKTHCLLNKVEDALN
eukprot:CAMPEP_0184869654 /NCGR_PEP_ID=MMETSP0580-20130426/34863_1 /TAXON_ID=1118495 /ORGANISM="Dactyliosolen fragilissimus" /LENGTH=234 /DNA_ID=CAMNT_0027371277 /DNA_START=12 /DNA_END=713 /DNA_ORIENTATION=+